MLNFKRNTPQMPVVLASLVLWASIVWGLPAESPRAEAEGAAEERWAGVRVSDAHDYAKCLQCGKKNETRAESCTRCGYELPQPSAEMTDPAWVLVPGYGYYKEGKLLEAAKPRKRICITGLVVAGLGLNIVVIKELLGRAADIYYIAGFSAMAVGAGLFIYGFVARTEPVYAFAGGEHYGPYDGAAYARRSPDPDGVAIKVEVTLLSF
jgi:ribosomal protein L37E